MHHGTALLSGERRVVDTQHVHFYTRRHQRHVRPQMLRHARRGVQGVAQPDLLDIIVIRPNGFMKALALLALSRFGWLLSLRWPSTQAQIMEHRPTYKKLRVIGQLLALAAQRAQTKTPAAVMVSKSDSMRIIFG